MATTTINGTVINKITKSQYEAEVTAGNITSEMQQNEVWLFTDDQHVSASEKTAWNNKSDFSGSYNDLTDKPTIPNVPTNVSAFTNDAGYLTAVPGEYITETELNSKGYLTSYTETDPSVPSHVKNITSTDISNWNSKSEFSGSYNDLTDKPTIPDVSGFETKTDASAKLAEAKTYADTKVANLVGTAPTTLDTLQEVAAAIQENEEVVDALNSAIGNKANSSDLSAVATSGSYNDLTNKPTLFSGSYNDLTNKPTLFSGSYEDLTNKPTIPTAVTKIWS